MRKTLKFLSVLLVLTMILAAFAACGQPPAPSAPDSEQSGQQNAGQQTDTAKVTVTYSVEGESVTEEYAAFSNSFLSIAYDDKTLRPEAFDDDKEELVKFESGDPLDMELELTAGYNGTYSAVASAVHDAEPLDEDIRSLSDLTDVTVGTGKYKAKYFSCFEEDSFHEYYFIEYAGKADTSVKYVVLEAEYAADAAETWGPRIAAMAGTLTFL